MWQRIQTLFLFLAAIASTFELFIVKNAIILTVATGIVSALSLVTIFLYKNRKLQIIFCITLMIILICLLTFFIIYLFMLFTRYNFFNLKAIEIAGLFLPVVSLIFIIFAKKFIKKDEKKVRSWERIR
jgi:hypothetical protein